MKKWEYLIETFKGIFGPDAPKKYDGQDVDGTYQMAMNELGDEGWELVAWDNQESEEPRAIFKRPKA